MTDARRQQIEKALLNTLVHVRTFDDLEGTTIAAILRQRDMWADKSARYRKAAQRLAAAYTAC